MFYDERVVDVIVELAQSQHGLGKAFERVGISASMIPAVVAERLREWVSAVDCYEF